MRHAETVSAKGAGFIAAFRDVHYVIVSSHLEEIKESAVCQGDFTPQRFASLLV